MDLIKLGTEALEANKAATAATTAQREEQDRLNDRARLRDLFENRFGVRVAEDDLIAYRPHSGSHTVHAVIVDGLSLGLTATSEGLRPVVLCRDGAVRTVDASLTVPLNRIGSLADLGKLLSSKRVSVATTTDSYRPGHGWLD